MNDRIIDLDDNSVTFFFSPFFFFCFGLFSLTYEINGLYTWNASCRRCVDISTRAVSPAFFSITRNDIPMSLMLLFNLAIIIHHHREIILLTLHALLLHLSVTSLLFIFFEETSISPVDFILCGY